jgi:hypothetical protein
MAHKMGQASFVEAFLWPDADFGLPSSLPTCPSACSPLDRQLAAKGLFIKAGTLTDASLIEADVKRPPMEQGEISARDPDAVFTRRGQRSLFGQKAHLAVGRGLI